MNKAAPMAACKGNQRIPSCGIINGISANAPAGAKYFPVHSKMANKQQMTDKATIVSGKCK